MADWDPIGVEGIPNAQDEYDSYAGTIAQMLRRNVSVEVLYRYLREVETNSIGVRGEPEKTLRTAERLWAHRIQAGIS